MASKFPSQFRWGAATAAYQIEGAVTEDGRGESIWDRFSNTPGNVANGDTGDVACDHYHRWRDDIALMSDLGIDAYRFSVAWPRVMPDGTGPVNRAGLAFYDRLVDGLLEAGIEPFVTLYHWDLPQALEDRGGWPERATAEAFAAYAEAVAAALGDRVRNWATLNEPWVSAHLGYGTGEHAPGRTSRNDAMAAAHHLLLGHGLATTAIRSAAPETSTGIVVNLAPQHPASPHPLDLEATYTEHLLLNRWYLDPITGLGYPAEGAADAGWDQVEIQDGDLDSIAVGLDFVGVNYYSRRVVRPHVSPRSTTPAPNQLPTTARGWEIYPEGLLETLEWVWDRYHIPEIYVTENGAAYEDDPADPRRDPERVRFLRDHVAAAREAVERGIPLKGYFVWSLLDNFEWAYGYDSRFGIVHVDFQTQARTPRDSARYWSAVASSGEVDPPGFAYAANGP